MSPGRRMGVSDSGQFLSRAIITGVPAAMAAALWGALYAGLAGLPWWSPLALYSTHMWGLSPELVVASGLFAAVVAGLVWLAMLGIAVGAIWGLLAGTVAPQPAGRRLMCAIGFVFGLALFGLATSARISLLPPIFHADLAPWAAALALGVMGAIIGGWSAPIPER